ncbi:Calpain-15 [Orchesella cincta]|uniref:Calpain-15 n=1 Tax=Orchesella cincta TaxID=48709 RepID=A0A1D2MHX5_ORCCI|nr:Calpain-15 [Orchesella cincta]
MTDQEATTPSSSLNTIMTNYAEIVAAFQIIRTLRIEDLKLHPDVFSIPFYRDTMLYREPEQDEFIGANEVLRKNVYYIATLTENVSDALVDQLLAGEILNEEECNAIRKQPTNKLRSVQLFAFLVGKEDPDNNILARILTTLKEIGNENVVEILQPFFDIENLDNNDAVVDDERHHPDGAHGGIADTEEGLKWTCRFCTFRNNAEMNFCEVCARTDNSDPGDSIDFVLCPKCTLVNEPGCDACILCDFRFNQVPQTDSSDDEEDS